MASGTQFPDTLVPDAPTVIDAAYRFTNADRAKIDAQITGTQGVVASLSTQIASATKSTATVSGSLSKGNAIVTSGGDVKVASSTNLTGVLMHAGLAISDVVNNTVTVVTQGLVDPTIVDVGAGAACAVGTNASGNPVRVTDPACVSGAKHLGVCDANGAIYVQPKAAWVVNARDYGAVGDGVTDDTAALLAWVAAGKAISLIASQLAGIRFYAPHGIYLCSEQLDFSTPAGDTSYSWGGITICGDGGNIVIGNGNRAATTLIYTGTGTSPFIAANVSDNFAMIDIAVLYSSGGFTGTLVDCGGYVTIDAETAASTFLRVKMGCDNDAHSTAAGMLSLDASLNAHVDQCTFGGANVGIFIAATNSLGTAIKTTIHGCQFGPTILTSGIRNAEFNTTIEECTFEDMPHALDDDRSSPASILGLRFNGNWCGDSDTFYASAWIDPGKSILGGASFEGNQFGQTAPKVAALSGQTVTVSASGKTYTRSAGSFLTDGFINGDTVFWEGFANADNDGFQVVTSLSATVMTCSGSTLTNEATVADTACTTAQHDSIKLGSAEGVSIRGNVLGTVDFSLVDGGSYANAVTITGNQLNGNNAPASPFWRNLSASNHGVVIHSNYPSGFGQGGDFISIAGHIMTAPSLRVQPTMTAASGASASVDGDEHYGSNDTAGRITLVVIGGGTSSGLQCTLAFGDPINYGVYSANTPKVILQPENAATAALPTGILATGIYVVSSADGFEIYATAGLAAGTYQWSYMVMG